MPTVFLVRPNDFIAEAMTALLSNIGAQALRLTSPAELEGAVLAGATGIVVSTAVTSEMPLSFDVVVRKVRQRAPAVPILATTLMHDVARAGDAVKAELVNLVEPLTVIPPGPRAGDHPALGHSTAVLVLRKQDIDEASPRTLELVRRHFRLEGR